ncbi:uncharacterized protein [Solanum lycopersicum]|uniref:uncharacterized protein n=1 Tax=Solanum lycopersicum TaxID=4081 RepID=UPI0002BCA562
MREAMVDEFINLKQGSMKIREYSLKFVKLSKYATSLVCNSRDEMSGFFTGIVEDLKEECRAAMIHDNMYLSRLMVLVQQVEKIRKRKNTRAWNRSRVKRNSEVDAPDERPPCRKCGKLHGEECTMGNACYSCGKPGNMVKDCPTRRIQQQGKERVESNGPSEEVSRRQLLFALKSRGAREDTSGEVSGE